MTSTWTWCWQCARLVEYGKVLPTEACPTCGWKRQRFTVEPTPAKIIEHPYRLNWMDVRLLQSFRIAPEVPEAS